MRKKAKISYFSISTKDTLLTLGILLASCAICLLLAKSDSTDIDNFAPHIFMLAIVLISRFTYGYVYSVFSSIFATLAVNYAFTYPYFSLNFTLTGYPFTFMAMLTVSLIVSMLTIRMRHQEQIRNDIEREKIYNNLLRSVSHDIRTPLTSIIGSAGAYLDNKDILSEEQKGKLISDISDEANWLIRVVENMLSITRINNNNASFNKNLEVVEEIVADAVVKFKRRFPDVAVHTKVPDELLLVPMDAILIEQVITNLLENSVHHGKYATDINVTVFTKDKSAIFRVSDNGAGIAKDVLPNIFTTYIKSTEDASDDHKNMGIGLSVCMSIIKAHGGSMTARNLPEGGACFEFNLPFESEEYQYDN